MLASMIGFAPAQAAESCKTAAEGDSGGITVKVCLDPIELTVKEGKNFTVHGHAETSTGDNVDCISESYKFRGNTNSSGKFNAGKVSENTDRGIQYTCTYETDDIDTLGGGAGGRVATALITDVVSQSITGVVHILNTNGNGNGDGDDDDHHKKKNKDDDDDNGNLPNTGGERLAWLVIGLLLVAAGTTVVVSSRKRDSVA
jgi:LPXTG-motif cell wall-anchored protein